MVPMQRSWDLTAHEQKTLLFHQIVKSHTPAAGTEETDWYRFCLESLMIHSESLVGNAINRLWLITMPLCFSLRPGTFSLSGISTLKVQLKWRQIYVQCCEMRFSKPPGELDGRFLMSFWWKLDTVIAQHILKPSAWITVQSQKEQEGRRRRSLILPFAIRDTKILPCDVFLERSRCKSMGMVTPGCNNLARRSPGLTPVRGEF